MLPLFALGVVCAELQSVHLLPRGCHADGESPLIISLPLSNTVTDGDWTEVHGRLAVDAPLTYVDFPVETNGVVFVPAEGTLCGAVGIDVAVPHGLTDGDGAPLEQYGAVDCSAEPRFSTVVDAGAQAGYLSWEQERERTNRHCRQRRGDTRSAVSPIARMFSDAASGVHEAALAVAQTNASLNAAAILGPLRQIARARRDVAVTVAKAGASMLLSNPCPLGGWQVPLQNSGDLCTDAATGIQYTAVRSVVLKLPAPSFGDPPPGAHVRIFYASATPDALASKLRYIPYRLRARCLAPSCR